MKAGSGVNGTAVWRLLIDEAGDAAANMAADEAMLLSMAAGESLPTLRFYSWNPAAVSVGYFQKADAEIDRTVCMKEGIDVVRRLTGGRAVLHEAEVTYSLAVPENEPYIPKGVTASYLFFSRGIIDGLERLGVAAQMQMPGSEGSAKGRTVHSAACFDAPSHYEITVGGRKVVGSAQVRKDGVILQHGSILLQFCPKRMTSLMVFDDETKRRAMTAELSRRATDLSQVTGRRMGFFEVVEAVQMGISEKCGLKLERRAWTQSEETVTKDLAAHKYSANEWNLRR